MTNSLVANQHAVRHLFASAHRLAREAQSTRQFIDVTQVEPSHPLPESTLQFLSQYWQQQLQPTSILDFSTAAEVLSDSYSREEGDEKIKASELIAEKLSLEYGTNIDGEQLNFICHKPLIINGLIKLMQHFFPQTKLFTFLPWDYWPYANESVYALGSIGLKGESYASVLQSRLQSLCNEDIKPGAFFIAHPNALIETVLTKQGAQLIHSCLAKFPDTPIIIDESLLELHPKINSLASLLMAYPENRKRLIILRSANGCLSAEANQLHMVCILNPEWQQKYLAYMTPNLMSIPPSLLIAYANGFTHMCSEELDQVEQYYQSRIDYISNRLKDLQVPCYSAHGGGYIIADFSHLLPSPTPGSLQQYEQQAAIMATDIDLAYAMVFSDYCLLTPMSYYGYDPKKGLLGIHCVADEATLVELMDRIEYRIWEIRRIKRHTTTKFVREPIYTEPPSQDLNVAKPPARIIAKKASITPINERRDKKR